MDASVNERSVMVACREEPRSAYLRCASWARLRRLGTRGGSTASCSLEDGEDATTTEQGIRAIPLKYAAFGIQASCG